MSRSFYFDSKLINQAKLEILKGIGMESVEGCRVQVRKLPPVDGERRILMSSINAKELAEIISKKIENLIAYYYVHYVDCKSFLSVFDFS